MQQAGAGINSGITGTTGELGANMGQTISQSGRAFPNIGTTGASQGATIGQSYRPDFMATATKNVSVPTAEFGRDYGFSDVAAELGGGDASKGYMKAGITALPIVASAFEPEYETFDEMREAEAYDPYATLNLNDQDTGINDALKEDSGLRLYADGGIVNQTPMNVNNAGANLGLNSIANLNQGASNIQGLGGLNVNTGAMGLSAEEQALIDNPKYRLVDTGLYGQKKYVPSNYTGIGQYQGGYGDLAQKAGEAEAQQIAALRAQLEGTGSMNVMDGGMNVNNLPTTKFAMGGLTQGPGDGMSDSLAAQIDGSQPAALSQGEFVVPADVVSHLGNGSTEAGSKQLYAMMDEVRKARTGTEKQGKEINPERYMPA